jgi:hypothetical protein
MSIITLIKMKKKAMGFHQLNGTGVVLYVQLSAYLIAYGFRLKISIIAL